MFKLQQTWHLHLAELIAWFTIHSSINLYVIVGKFKIFTDTISFHCQ